MKRHTQQRRAGFRFSVWDALILLAGACLTWWLRTQKIPLWWIVPMALGHFFLFCNVFLVWRRLELIWAALFVANVAAHVAIEELEWWPPVLWQLPVTLFVIAWQMRSPWYHGIFARQINPRLPEYLQGVPAQP
ncbi:MAG TPA: hypothetical protein VGE39_02390 [Prosthecobacter sp.]